jgi:hypothetical protein
MSLNAIITNALADAASQMTTQVLHTAVERLATKYGFDFAEAIQFVNLEPARPEVLKKTDLPWCCTVYPECCSALAYRNGLFSQCHKAPVADGLCGACSKQKAETGSLKNGDVHERMASDPFAFRDGKVARFSKVMEKNGWTQELVERSAAAYGLTIPSENFIESKPKRGRKVTRPVMNTPEPLAITVSEEVVPPIVSDVDVDVDVDSEVSEEVAPTPLANYVTYNATDPDSDEELEEEAPKPKKAEKKKADSGDEAEKPKKKKAEKKKADSGDEAEAKKPKAKKEKAESGDETEAKKPKAKKEKADSGDETETKKPKAKKADSGDETEAKKPKAKKAESGDEAKKAESSDETEPKAKKADSGDESDKKKAVIDYSDVTAEQVAALKPMALRTAAAQHGIVIGSKSAETLRAELIAKVSA